MVEFNDDNKIIQEAECRAILVGVQMKEDLSYYMEELNGLAEAANIVVLGQVIQNREKPTSALYIGKGKVEEIAEMCKNMDANTVIFNNELSGMQIRNLEDATGVTVLDRTILILDIFARRATSGEGKLQVEMAQLQYRLPRLLGFGKSLSHTGAGIGTRGPGEKKLEIDRRHIRHRIDEIKKEIDEAAKVRATQRSKREKEGKPIVALVGYTNSGKSAIMNCLLNMSEKSEKTVFEEDMLFATLGTSHRKIKLDSKHEFILIDTVGFVSKLPHLLIKAFKSTLEEVVYADLLLNIVDASFEQRDFHIDVTDKVLKEIGAADKEKIIVYNKIDLVEDRDPPYATGEKTVYVSAKTGEGIETLIDEIKKAVFGDFIITELMIPYENGSISSYLCEKCKVLEMDYRNEGTYFKVELEVPDYNRLEKWRITS